MAEIGAVVLYKLLQEKSLEGWAKLKLNFFNASYVNIYSTIRRYYNKYNNIPSFEEVELFVRDNNIKQSIFALKNLDIPEEVELDAAIDFLINEYTQNEALKEISKFIDTITTLDSQEIKEHLSSLAVALDEKTYTDINIVTADTINIFEHEESTAQNRVFIGLNNGFDANVGTYKGEVILFGGKRGQGKSITLCNISANQFEQNSVVPYFTIEMKASEIFQRNLAILANVSAKAIRNNTLSNEEIERVARIRASMFLNGENEYNDFISHKDRFKFETNLINNYELDPNRQLIIIHDVSLSIATIDIHLQKLKSKYGDKLKVAVIDYINQISLDGHRDDRYDWKVQIEIAAKLKEFASKYDLLIASAYQIDSTNEARFSKGILDSPDISYILDTANKSDGIISFQNTKTRSSEPLDFKCPIDWETLKIYATETSTASIAKSISAKLGKDKDDIPF